MKLRCDSEKCSVRVVSTFRLRVGLFVTRYVINPAGVILLHVVILVILNIPRYIAERETTEGDINTLTGALTPDDS